jgi:hypothetical protein
LGGYVAATITKACRIVTDGATPPTLRLESVSETFRFMSRNWDSSLSNGVRRNSLLLARRPIVAIVSITENDVVLTAADYEVDKASGLIYRLSDEVRCHWPGGTIIVVYSAGYLTVPDDLKYAAIKFVQYQLQLGDRDPFLQMKSTTGVSEYRWHESHAEPNIPAHVMDILQTGSYVNKWVG